MIRFLLISSLALTAGAAVAASGRPNVLLIIDDDLCSTLGAYGGEAVTPNVDRLAARGTRFDRAYVQYPVCNPSRSSLLTGWRPDTTGIYDNKTALRQKFPEAVTLPQLFRENGYFTAGIGKIFHQGVDAAGRKTFFQDAKSWEFFADHLHDTTLLGEEGEGRNLAGGKLKWCTWRAAEGGDDDQPDGQNVAEAIRVLEQRREAPFFLAVGLHKPHDPFVAPKKYFDLYPLEKIVLPKPPADRTPDLPLALPREEAFASFTDAERREFKRAYLAGVSFMDAQIGKLFDTLDRQGLWENTIVIFASDHGYHLGEHDWWNKVTVFERCARAPLIVWAPGARAAGKNTRAIVEFVDLYPTLADLCGLKAPPHLQGESFRAVLENPALAGKSAAYTQVTRGRVFGRSVRTDRWRYTEWDGGNQGAELYEVSDDPENYYNLAADPAHAATVAELRTLLSRYP